MKYKKYRIKNAIFLIFIFGSLLFSYIDDISLDNLFKEAVEYYKKGDFISSEKQFLQILEILKNKQQTSFEILYNLGNCYYRQNKLGLARYYYELAKQVDYHNPDINYNLKFVKKITNNNLEENFFDSLINFMSFKELLVLLMLFNFIFFGCLIIENFVIFNSFYWIKRISLLFFIIFLILGILRYNKEIQNIGIIVETTNLLSAPEESELVKSVGLNEAKKVVILSEKDEYYAVYLLQDKVQGWIKKDKVKKLKI